MEKNGSRASEPLEQCKYFWEEYKYRHDLIWQRIFSFTTAVVLISIIPYVQIKIAGMLGPWILIAPVLATVLSGFGFVVIQNELTLFRKIKMQYRRRQNELLDDDLKHDLCKESDFERLVRLYLGILTLLSVVNGLIAWLVWLPKV